MNKFIAFFHHLIDPHCEHCYNENQDARVCQSCETLRQQLEIANHEKKELLDRLIKPEIPISTSTTEEFKPKSIPWSVRRQMVEAEDRKRASIMREKEKELSQLEKLEKEVIGEENAS